MTRFAPTLLSSILVTLMAIGFTATTSHALITRDDAKAIAIATAITGSDTETTLLAYLFRSTDTDSVLQAGERIYSDDYDLSVDFTATSETYFIWIDDFPIELYEHPTRYVFIDANTGVAQVFEANVYPSLDGSPNLWSSSQERVDTDDLFFGDISQYNMLFITPLPDARDPGLTTEAQPFDYWQFAAGETCGVIFTAPDGTALDSAAATDAKRARRIMESKGVAPGAIKEIKPGNGKAMADSLKAAAAGKKKLWVYYSGHGWKSKTNGDGGPWVPNGATWADRHPTWKALACSLEAGGADEACIIIDCCFSGRAVSAFQMKNITGIISTSSHSDSTSVYWYRYKTLPSGKRMTTYAESHFTAALDSCFMDASADGPDPGSDVGLTEAHAWARNDDKAKKKKPPAAGILTTIDWEYILTFTIPPSLVDPFVFPEALGLATDEAGLLFASFPDPLGNPLIIEIQPDLAFPGFNPICPPFNPLLPPTDFAFGGFFPGEPRFLYTGNPPNQLGDLRFCNPLPPQPFPDFSSVARLPFGQPFVLGANTFPEPVLGWQTQLLGIQIDPVAQPVLSGDQFFVDFTTVANGQCNQIIDFLPLPLDPLEAPTHIFPPPDLLLPMLVQPQGLDLMLQAVVLDPFSNTMNPVKVNPPPAPAQNPAGVGALRNVGGGGGPAGPGVPLLFLLEKFPGPGGHEIHVYEITGLGGGLVSVPNDPSVSSRVSLAPAKPNPTHGASTIDFTLPVASKNAKLSLYDVSGRQVRVLQNGGMSAGSHTFTWDGRDDRGRHAAAGVYFYRLEADQGGKRIVRSQRLVRLR